MYDFCVDYGILVNFVSCVFEYVEVLVIVFLMWIFLLGLFIGEDCISYGCGVRSFIERFFIF